MSSEPSPWSEIFAALHPGRISTEAEIARAEGDLGFPLPASYRGFCRDCGAGLAGGAIRIATPLPYPAADLVGRSETIAYSIAAALEQVGPPAEVGGGELSPLDRACFFGEAEDGSFLFWEVDAEGSAEDGPLEYDIWVLAPDLETLRFGAESLDALFRALQDERVRIILGEAAEPLPALFEGIEDAVLARSGDVG